MSNKNKIIHIIAVVVMMSVALLYVAPFVESGNIAAIWIGIGLVICSLLVMLNFEVKYRMENRKGDT